MPNAEVRAQAWDVLCSLDSDGLWCFGHLWPQLRAQLQSRLRPPFGWGQFLWRDERWSVQAMPTVMHLILRIWGFKCKISVRVPGCSHYSPSSFSTLSFNTIAKYYNEEQLSMMMVIMPDYAHNATKPCCFCLSSSHGIPWRCLVHARRYSLPRNGKASCHRAVLGVLRKQDVHRLD